MVTALRNQFASQAAELASGASAADAAADMDPWAAGLHLVPPEARTLVPAGADPGFTHATLARCIDWLAACMGVAYLGKLTEPRRFGRFLGPPLVYLGGHGPLLCAITTAAYVQEFRGADRHWDKTEKTGRVAAPA